METPNSIVMNEVLKSVTRNILSHVKSSNTYLTSKKGKVNQEIVEEITGPSS